MKRQNVNTLLIKLKTLIANRVHYSRSDYERNLIAIKTDLLQTVKVCPEKDKQTKQLNQLFNEAGICQDER